MSVLPSMLKLWKARGAGGRGEREPQGQKEKQAEAALKDSQEWYRELVELCPDAVVVHQDFRLKFANAAALQLYHATDFEQLRGRSMLELVHPEDQAAVIERVKHILNGGRAALREQRLLRLDGGSVVVEAAGAPIQWQGRPAVQTVLRDITRRKQMEDALRQSEMQLQRVIDGSPNIIFLKDTDGRFILANQTLERCMGVAPGGWRGKTDYDLLPKEKADGYCKDDRRVLEEGCSIQIEEMVLMPDGAQHTFLANKFPLFDSQGKPYALCGISTDITDRKKVEAALHRTQEELAAANRALDEAVQERTTELRKTVMDLHEFSHALVHDLRAPLRAIHSFISVIEQDCAPCRQPPLNDYVKRIQGAALRMDDLIRDALNYSKLLRYPLPLSSIQLDELLKGMLQTYPHLQPPAIEITLEPNLPAVLGNAAALTECFSNLFDNAIKFARPGVRPKVRIHAEPRDSCWRICVEDNGIGIAPEQTARLFDIFFRLEQKSARSTGIGLAIVRKAAERMRGKVGVESEPGNGSRFWIELEPPRDSNDSRFPADYG